MVHARPGPQEPGDVGMYKCVGDGELTPLRSPGGYHSPKPHARPIALKPKASAKPAQVKKEVKIEQMSKFDEGAMAATTLDLGSNDSMLKTCKNEQQWGSEGSFENCEEAIDDIDESMDAQEPQDQKLNRLLIEALAKAKLRLDDMHGLLRGGQQQGGGAWKTMPKLC